MTRLLPFSLLVTPAVGKEVRYLFASRKALLSFASKMMRERFVGSRVPYMWDMGQATEYGEWTLDMQTAQEFDKPVNIKAVFEQVATLFVTFADMDTLAPDAKEELLDAVQQAFNLAEIEWYPLDDTRPEPTNDYWQERRNIERDLPINP